MPGGTKRYGPGQALYGPGHGTVSSPVPVWHGLSRRWTPPEKVLTASCGSDIRKWTFFRNEECPGTGRFRRQANAEAGGRRCARGLSGRADQAPWRATPGGMLARCPQSPEAFIPKRRSTLSVLLAIALETATQPIANQ